LNDKKVFKTTINNVFFINTITIYNQKSFHWLNLLKMLGLCVVL
jgi:hypothetical protein